MEETPVRSFANVRRLNFTGMGNNAHLTLPKEVSDLLRRAEIKAVRVTLTDEGILLTPYREPKMPAWATDSNR